MQPGGLGKWANHYLQRQLLRGARAVALRMATKTDPRSRWFQAAIDRRGLNKGIVAMPNKTARIAWAMLTREEDLRPRLKRTSEIAAGAVMGA